MKSFLENLVASLWNRAPQKPCGNPAAGGDLMLGWRLVDGQISRQRVTIPGSKRCEHSGLLGKTGSGKSFCILCLAAQDITAGRGWFVFDFHRQLTSFLLKAIAAEELRTGRQLSERLIVIDPADPDFSVGLNVLEHGDVEQSFVQIAEFAQILKQRWHLDSFGARTEELLRNSLYLLADMGLMLLELSLLLTNSTFRTRCLRKVTNPEVEIYFRTRYDQASEAMQAVFRDAILNKVSAFTSDPRFRHIVGQQHSTFSLLEAIDRGCWVLLNLDKGRLGEQAATLGSLFLTKLKNALFARKTRTLFTLYCDEIQNLVTYDSSIDTLLAEARKFGVSIISANQFLDQYPPQIRSAILSVGTHIFFQLSHADADKMARALGGGKSLAHLLKNLPPRHMVVKSGHHRWQQARVPDLTEPQANSTDLYRRCRLRWARPRAVVEQEIRRRHRAFGRSGDEVLHDWE